MRTWILFADLGGNCADKTALAMARGQKLGRD
jgi:hypothetical protein